VDNARPGLQREVCLLLLALAAAGLTVTLAAAVCQLMGVHEPERMARKGLVPLVVICWIWIARVPRGGIKEAFGLTGARDPIRTVGMGLLFGVTAMVTLNGVLFALGARTWEPELGYGALMGKAVLYLLQALALGLLEEVLFRGVLHGRLRAAAGPAVAVWLGSFIFAAAHFLRPPKDRQPEAWWDTMPACFAGLHNMLTERWREFLGLLLVGLVLALIREGRRTIYLAMGVHAGWVWVRFVSNKIVEEVDATVDTDPLLFGSKRLYDGLIGWCALALTLAFVWRQLKRRDGQKNHT